MIKESIYRALIKVDTKKDLFNEIIIKKIEIINRDPDLEIEIEIIMIVDQRIPTFNNLIKTISIIIILSIAEEAIQNLDIIIKGIHKSTSLILLLIT